MNITVTTDILIYSFRYALGRQSYCVSDVVKNIKDNWEKLNINDKQLIIKEIKIAIENNKIGMEIDKKNWEEILKLEI